MTPRAYTINARKRGEPTIRINLVASSKAEALSAMREFYPMHLITIIALTPEWGTCS